MQSALLFHLSSFSLSLSLTLAPTAQLDPHALVHKLGQVDRVLAARHLEGRERDNWKRIRNEQGRIDESFGVLGSRQVGVEFFFLSNVLSFVSFFSFRVVFCLHFFCGGEGVGG